MTTRFRPLCLDPFDDRAVPSHGHFDPSPDLSFVAALRADLPAPAADHPGPGGDGPRGFQGHGADDLGPLIVGPGRDGRGDDRFVVLVIVPSRAVEPPSPSPRPVSTTPTPTPTVTPTADRVDVTPADRPAARVFETEAVAEPMTRAEAIVADQPPVVASHLVGIQPPAAVHEPVRAAGAGWPADTSAVPVVTTVAPTSSEKPVPVTPAADPSGPAAAAQGQPGPAGVVAASPDPAADAPPDTAPAPSAQASVPVVETAPVPSLVGRVIEAVFPSGGPLGGALLVDLVAVEADAAGLLAGLTGLDAATDGWASPERWAWLTAAALTVGGVGYVAVGDARGRRRAGPVAVATDSALARWEERNGDRTG